MTRVTRQKEAGRAYLDLQNRARRERRNTQELLTLYVVERWLARLSRSAYTEQFVLKGGMLLATFGARRPTADADALARHMANDEATVVARIVEIAGLADNDGVEFRTNTVTARTIRDEALYAGVRVTMDAQLATATVRFRIDVNFGDPVTPAPQMINLPALRPDSAPIRILGYPIETVLAEKITTAITLGAANTRVRDYADIYTLIGTHDLQHATLRDALVATGQFRGTSLQPLSTTIDDLAELRHATYAAYRTSLGADGEHLPKAFSTIVDTVVAFADHLIEAQPLAATWHAQDQSWNP
ncbi:nucleotidyl transferase AbiEii/AbiGii toxin family protein [Amycolatopsis alkalitolerans]|uniref:Nucleotidyl transferase AbiEii/AbiGii toxin family protein n=1 Tax=Amycolatopsis alkalitolerans TaxID=2547244 RepID=A0A5C4LUE6_9PSEU|nr:nucleotidyl transferase AbiEii/AbiGii toxin family protein [Amycolatopsis alkalitolerans]TNC21447.1 nucleotidyl transferase AbiEii/AbiGii toxin family protein [Amycolatopsis alkalitolerans]